MIILDSVLKINGRETRECGQRPGAQEKLQRPRQEEDGALYQDGSSRGGAM